MSAVHETREFLGVAAVFGSERMRRLLAVVEKVAASNAGVLITGESGCGKEIIARAIHHYSLRGSKSWVDVNCAALPENLMESELFGYEKGAFSGADCSKPGIVELANHGTLFLDEIGDLDRRMQVKLLRLLDGAPYYRLGGVKKITVNIRLVTATNQDLEVAVQEGRFRLDLYHRLSQVQIPVPPLRERKDDIIPLVEHYLAVEKPGLRFSKEAMERLCSYSWPGNVRELRNIVMRAAIFASGPEITATELAEQMEQTSAGSVTASLHNLAHLDALERGAILKALEESDGHQQRAADKLGISKRTLQRKIKSYGASADSTLALAGYS